MFSSYQLPFTSPLLLPPGSICRLSRTAVATLRVQSADTTSNTRQQLLLHSALVVVQQDRQEHLAQQQESTMSMQAEVRFMLVLLELHTIHIAYFGMLLHCLTFGMDGQRNAAEFRALRVSLSSHTHQYIKLHYVLFYLADCMQCTACCSCGLIRCLASCCLPDPDPDTSFLRTSAMPRF